MFLSLCLPVPVDILLTSLISGSIVECSWTFLHVRENAKYHGDDLKYKEDLQNEHNLKNEDNLKNEEDIKIEDLTKEDDLKNEYYL